MMSLYLCAAGVILAAAGSLFFATLTFALREFVRTALTAEMVARGRTPADADFLADHRDDYVFVAGLARLLCNTLVLIFLLEILRHTGREQWLQYAVGAVITGLIGVFFSVALPHALAHYAGEKLLAMFYPPLVALRAILRPLTVLMHATDRMVRNLAGATGEGAAERAEAEMHEEILSAVHEGEKEGVVDDVERVMIESVITFGDTTVGQIMTSRPQIAALDVKADLDTVKETLERSGHSRVPVYEGTLDKVIGILYARDLLHHLGHASPRFDVRSAMRQPVYVPETKSLKDLLRDFRHQKVHIAIVLDEYGGTAGLITIEDVLEELVGDISDEHEPKEPSMFRRLDESAADVDARMYLDELNRLMNLDLPEDGGYDTLAGFVNATAGKIPEAGATFTYEGARFTVTEAEPQRVVRVKIERLVPADDSQIDGKNSAAAANEPEPAKTPVA